MATRGTGHGRNLNVVRGRGGSLGSSARRGLSLISSTLSEADPNTGLPDQDANVIPIGVKRSSFGTSGRGVQVYTNHFQCDITPKIIYHYDVAMIPCERSNPTRSNMELIRLLQEVIAPEIFSPKAVYDGRKNMFSTHRFSFPDDTQQFAVTMADPAAPPSPDTRPPQVYSIRLTMVTEINLEVLSRFLEGKQTQDYSVQTALAALNVVVRMDPVLKYPFHARSFLTDRETRDIGMGIVLRRGYFQFIRPSIGRILMNIDISTGMMYKPGPLITLCLEFLGVRDKGPNALSPPQELNTRDRGRLQRFLSGLCVTVNVQGQAQLERPRTPRIVKKISRRGAADLTFMRGSGRITVANYFQTTYNYTLQYPNVFCVEARNGALIPAELCVVPPGQIMRNQVPPEKISEVLNFATKKPQARLKDIRAGLGVFAHGQSDYVRTFGVDVKGAAGPLSIDARVLTPPVLRYGPGSKQPTTSPHDGVWNMTDKLFYSRATVHCWAVVIYERQPRFNQQTAAGLVTNLLTACKAVGITVRMRDPAIKWENPQGRVSEQLLAVGRACNARHGKFPDLLVVVLPEGATNLYAAIKHFGDIQVGVATQCLMARKCNRRNTQYFADVCLKINVKRGGINTIPEARATSLLADPHNPTIVMGASVTHPAPGLGGHPSFAALVASMDANCARYIADCKVQGPWPENVEDLQFMAKEVLEQYMSYRRNVEKKAIAAPKRIIFYRGSISKNQFKQVLEYELPSLKWACEKLEISPNITFIAASKRHHVRFFPKWPHDGDIKSGNCAAGTVVDRDITHPIEQDFYLQSHAGLLGTSRPTHYNVLYDENKLTADEIQQLSYTLCHVYARSTRSVSIPAPVYYANIVCSRAKNHYNPEAHLGLTGTEDDGDDDSEVQFQRFRANFRSLHANTKRTMYFL